MLQSGRGGGGGGEESFPLITCHFAIVQLSNLLFEKLFLSYSYLLEDWKKMVHDMNDQGSLLPQSH